MRTGFKLLLFLMLALPATSVCVQAGESADSSLAPLVTVSTGILQGLETDGVESFRGIPYAEAPVGALRWHAPLPAAAWSGLRQATEFGPACPQPPNLLFADSGPQDEDCLYLNVWTPDHTRQGMPVLVYLHGGAFQWGSSSQAVYDGAALASRGVVVVTLNYRLGVLGFLAHPQLSAESSSGSSGNYALLDQLLALHWVQENIAQFGGDPQLVTLMGESAGAVSVCALLSSPLADGLFQRAIVMSGGAPDRLRDLHAERLGMQSMEDLGSGWAANAMERLGLTDFAELRDVPWQELQGEPDLPTLRREFNVTSAMSMDDSLCIDGYVLTESPAEVFRSGRQLPVPLMAGSLSNEGGMFTLGLHFSSTDQYSRLLTRIFGAQSTLALQLYPAADTDTALNQLSSFINDGFASGARAAVREMSATQTNCWLYRFDFENPAARLTGIGTFHGSEVPYFFSSFPLPLVYGRSSQLLSERLSAYLITFMQTGDPNQDGYTVWPRYAPEAEQLMEIDLPMRAAQCERSAHYDLIESSGIW